MKSIPLTRGKVAIVDDEDYDFLVQWKWYYHADGGYAARREGLKIIFMHNEITRPPEGKITDHWDLNGLNNVNKNLRVCTHSQNHANAPLQKNNTSGYKGVYFEKWTGRYKAQITFKGKNKNLGRHDSKELAAKAYNRAAKKLFGKFARLNVIP